jgi:2-methylisocitrate lyase-like PEP mutase family enzyme
MTMKSLTRDARPLAFKALHQSEPGFIMPNAWDAGSAVILAEAGFKAIATTSGGIAFSLGKPDYTTSAARLAVSREEMFARMAQIVRAVDLPVNGDLEAGYGHSPEEVAATIRMAIAVGLAGGNIEDKRPGEDALYDEALAVERIAAARETIDAAGSSFVLTARTDVLMWPEGDESAAMAQCIRRANKFQAAGADCVFTPGACETRVIAQLVQEIEAPLNLVFGLSAGGNPCEWIAIGVRRVSTGASLARAGLRWLRDSAYELQREGAVHYAAQQLSQNELNELFQKRLNDCLPAQPKPLE